MNLIRILVKEGLTGLYYVKKMVLIPEKAVLLTRIWPNMGLITILCANLYLQAYFR